MMKHYDGELGVFDRNCNKIKKARDFSCSSLSSDFVVESAGIWYAM